MTTLPDQAALPGGAPGYGIATLASLTGLSQDVIRTWERRYKALSPGRTGTGRRLYGEADLARLRLLAGLTARGHAISTLAPLTTDQLLALTPSQDLAPDDERAAARTREGLLAAFTSFDGDRAARLLGRASLAFDPLALCERVLGPVLEEVGRGWSEGRISIAQEHAASSVIRAHLLGLLQTTHPPASAPVCVVATLAGEGHDLGALFAALLAAQAGQRVVFLGGSLPTSDIARAVEQTGASRLLLSLVALPADEAREQLETLARVVDPRVTLQVGGRGASCVQLPPRCELASLASIAP